MRRTPRVLLALLLIPFGLCAQQRDSVKRSDVIRFADGVLHTYSAPSRWKGKDWLKLGGILAGTAALTLADDPVRNFWVRQDSKFLDGVNTVGYHYGKPYSAALFTGGFYAVGMLFKSEWAKETGLMLGTGLFSAGLLEMTLKPVVGRARPETGEDNYEVTFFNKEAGFHSFPSGHASMAFTISMIMARRVKSVPLKIGFYSLAASTAVCRLYSDAHWISDVAFGGVIAWFCADVAIERLEANRMMRHRPDGMKLNVYPNPAGITVRATF